MYRAFRENWHATSSVIPVSCFFRTWRFRGGGFRARSAGSAKTSAGATKKHVRQFVKPQDPCGYRVR